MIEKHLGETIDIHGGGVDLVFPHHENEVAQSECAHGKTFVKYWMHNGYLEFGGGKMSKSEGNIQSIDGLLKKFGHKGGEALRLMLLTAHYRQPLDFSDEIVTEQIERLNKWYRLMEGVEAAEEIPDAVIAALEDDLNTPKALAELSALAKPGTAAELKAGANFLGLLEQRKGAWFKQVIVLGLATETSTAFPVTVVKSKSVERALETITAGPIDIKKALSEKNIDKLIARRVEARANKDFAESDRIRDELAEQGIKLLDMPDGTTDWERAD